MGAPVGLLLFFLFCRIIFNIEAKSAKKDGPVADMRYITKDVSDCEVCRVLANRLEDQFEQTGRYYQVIDTGYNFEDRFGFGSGSNRRDYRKSQLRLIESTERVCEHIFTENMEYERKLNDSSRVDRPREIHDLKGKCDQNMEKYEDKIERWYYKMEGSVPIQEYLCRKVILKGKSQACLDENKTKEKKGANKEKKKKDAETDMNLDFAKSLDADENILGLDKLPEDDIINDNGYE